MGEWNTLFLVTTRMEGHKGIKQPVRIFRRILSVEIEHETEALAKGMQHATLISRSRLRAFGHPVAQCYVRLANSLD